MSSSTSSNKPFDAGYLAVGGGHRIAYEQHGNPQGIPALVLHGGPGSSSSPAQRQFFDLADYRVIQFDQRGCGRSEPAGETSHNRTDLLLDDIESLRKHLQIGHWLVVGGSWGATLAALYAAAHPVAVSGVLLRGLFLATESDVHWFFHGAASIYPNEWSAFSDPAPRNAHAELLPWLFQVFSREDLNLQNRVAQGWFAWESALSGSPAIAPQEGEVLHKLIQRYRVQTHYLHNRCWLAEGAILNACAQLKTLPVCFLHGESDAICRPQSSLLAHQACPGSQLEWVKEAGHDPFHPGMRKAMSDALSRFARNGQFSAP